ncbi:hypothetical protein DL767_011548 [Monosporascus sp. MG133]|nr:hypothetical protein DL767_011548 [Monosporascus sp. MG133]
MGGHAATRAAEVSAESPDISGRDDTAAFCAAIREQLSESPPGVPAPKEPFPHRGLWQLSYPAWGSDTAEEQRTALVRLIESGLTAADMADHYPAPAIGDQAYAAMKWCVFGPVGHPITTEWVLAQVRSAAQGSAARSSCRSSNGPTTRGDREDAPGAYHQCGGFRAEKWLRRPAPTIYAESESLTPPQRKQPVVGAVIVGTRLGVAAHGDENVEVFGFELEDSDLATINAVPLGADLRKTDAVFDKLGDRGNEYRAMH